MYIRMNYKIYPSSNELKSIVKHYIVFNSLENIEKILFLPNGDNFIILNRGIAASTKLFGNEEVVHIPSTFSISFKTNRIKQIHLDAGYVPSDASFPIIIVELLPIGFFKLFNTDASSLGLKYLEIDKEIIDKYLSKVYTFETIEEELKYLDNSLIELNDSWNNHDLQIEDVVHKIYNDYNLEVRIEDLLEEFKYSRSTLERHFKKMIGLTPKQFIIISKFCKTILEYIGEKRTFHELQHIYSDNSHMNVVFRKFLGIAPSEIFKKVVDGELAIFQLLNLNKLNSIKENKVINSLDVLKYSENLNVLYIEDEKALRDATAKLLVNYFKNLDLAVDGEDGLNKYVNNHTTINAYDLIITDINMPNMDGIEMSKRILKLAPNQSIIIISAHCEYMTSAKEIGIKAILTKPVEYKELVPVLYEASKEIHTNKL